MLFQVFFQVSFVVLNIVRKMPFYCILDKFVVVISGMFIVYPVVQIASFAGLLF